MLNYLRTVTLIAAIVFSFGAIATAILASRAMRLAFLAVVGLWTGFAFAMNAAAGTGVGGGAAGQGASGQTRVEYGFVSAKSRDFLVAGDCRIESGFTSRPIQCKAHAFVTSERAQS